MAIKATGRFKRVAVTLENIFVDDHHLTLDHHGRDFVLNFDTLNDVEPTTIQTHVLCILPNTKDKE